MLALLQKQAEQFPETRTGKNLSFRDIEDVVLSAFSVFYLQHPSFLNHQQQMELEQGHNNARALFGIQTIPTANHIKALMDGAPPSLLEPVYEKIVDALYQQGMLDDMRAVNDQLLIALDGVQFHNSKKIYCAQCSRKDHKNGSTQYSHNAITPVIVSPNHKRAISLPPEFIQPQDGHEKQDCEQAAGKRWLEQHGSHYQAWGATLLGDDLYSRQPFCEQVQAQGCHFIFVCKPSSHTTLYEWLEGFEKTGHVQTRIVERRKGKKREIDSYRFINQLPLRDGDDALMVNWCELVTTTPEGKELYRNTFVTDHTISHENVIDMVASGRSRWKIENENNNTLKTKGYHLEHNFGHGKKSLANVLASMNLLAFLFHTVLDLTCEIYGKLRAKLGARKKFFEHLRTLTHYIYFDSWANLLRFMAERLKVAVEWPESR
jgi:hypothetical protein